MAGVREQDQLLPIANVIRIMRRILPAHAKISDDAKETIQECVSEYISFITAEANEKCQAEQRRTVTADDVLWAMEKLGFDNYLPPLHHHLHRYRDIEGEPASVRRVSACISAMEMMHMHAHPLAPQHQHPLAPPPTPQLPAAYSPFGGMFDFDPTSQAFYRDEHHASASGSSSSSGGGYIATTFDPYANNINRQ